jgi:Pyruvate/2-oxoacid:ferredoxin oxidoreductase delta subunit
MLFAMLQDQHTKQIAKMEAANKANMDAMMERVNALMTANGGKPTHQPDKENHPPGGNVNPLTGGGKRVKKPKKKKTLCPNCKMFVLHKPESCYELEANKSTHYPGWKSIFAATPTA